MTNTDTRTEHGSVVPTAVRALAPIGLLGLTALVVELLLGWQDIIATALSADGETVIITLLVFILIFQVVNG